MSHNTFGHLFRVTTFGESHGPAIGCVVDGCPPGIPLDGGGHPSLSRQAQARPIALHDPAPRSRTTVQILSGVFPDDTTRRAGHDRHADCAAHRERRPAIKGLRRHPRQVPARPRRFHLRREIRPARLSRRRTLFSARDRSRVAAGAIARKVLRGCHAPRRAGADRPAQDRPGALGLGRGRPQSVLLPGRGGGGFWEDYLDGIRKSGLLVGAMIEVVAEGVPAGSGAPVYGKLDADLAGAMMRSMR